MMVWYTDVYVSLSVDELMQKRRNSSESALELHKTLLRINIIVHKSIFY